MFNYIYIYYNKNSVILKEMEQQLMVNNETFDIIMDTEDMYEITTNLGEKKAIWKPLNRPFKILKTVKNLILNYSFSPSKKNNSMKLKLCTVYHKDLLQQFLEVKNNVHAILVHNSFTNYNYVEHKDLFNYNKFTVWINKLKKNENDKKQNPMKVFINEEEVYFDSIIDFMDFVKNKICDADLDMYFEVEINKSQETWTLKPFVYSFSFLREPKKDMKILSFNKLSFEEQVDFFKEQIFLSMEKESNKDVKIFTFLFQSLYFDFPSIHFAEESKKIYGKVFEPKLWVGKKKKYDENSTSKESLIFIANEQVRLFMENIEKIFETFLPQLTASLTKKMKTNGMNLKIGKKDFIKIKTPLLKHEEVKLTDDDEIVKVEDGDTLFSLNVKQPNVSEETENKWEEIPQNLKYSIINPKIGINKLWYDDKEKQLVMQMVLSRNIKIQEIEENVRVYEN